jgi:hypothetical protein
MTKIVIDGDMNPLVCNHAICISLLKINDICIYEPIVIMFRLKLIIGIILCRNFGVLFAVLRGFLFIHFDVYIHIYNGTKLDCIRCRHINGLHTQVQMPIF